jgi:hypothetical protein
MTHGQDHWWIATLGTTLLWARLTVRPAGTAEVLDHDGQRHGYETEDSARSALLDAGYAEFDGLDADEALAQGIDLDRVAPPPAEDPDADDDALIARMRVNLGPEPG